MKPKEKLPDHIAEAVYWQKVAEMYIKEVELVINSTRSRVDYVVGDKEHALTETALALVKVRDVLGWVITGARWLRVEQAQGIVDGQAARLKEYSLKKG